MITKSEVDAAVARITGYVRATPVLRVEPGPFGPGLLLKCEYTQHTGSFKARGAFNRILSATERHRHGDDAGSRRNEDAADAWRDGGAPADAGRGGAALGSGRDGASSTGHSDATAGHGFAAAALGCGEAAAAITGAGVVAASGGNAGLAVAYAAARLRVPATVFVPTTAPVLKVDRLRALGAEVRQVGTEFAQANEAAVAHAAESGALFCHAYDQPQIVAGQGGVAIELLGQAPDVDTVLVSVGGGGLAGGIAAGLDGRARLVAVEPETIPTLHTALAKGGPVDVEVSGVAADSLGARRIGDLAFDLAVRHGVHSVLVDDAAIIAARQLLWDELRIVVEHGTAAALAAVTTGAYRPEPDETVAVILCGANTNPSDLV